MLNRRGFVLTAALAALSGCGSKFRRYNGPEVTRLIIFKQQRKLHLLHEDKALKTYQIGLGGNPVGPKQFEGDMKTPEGAYRIDRQNPNSAYHLSIGISYPNHRDVELAEALGKKPGGDIFIHGQARKNRGRGRDWTAGCVAVKDKEMEEIYAMVRLGTEIFIYA